MGDVDQGYALFDGTTIAFTVVPASYYVGADARAALGDNGWPPLGKTGGVTYPVNAKRVSFIATQDVYIYWMPLELIFAIANGVVAGLPPPGFYLANTVYELPVRAAMIMVVRATVNGNLHINFLS